MHGKIAVITGGGIRINAVCPGIIRTPMFERFAAADPARRDAVAASIPAGRFGTAEEIAQTALFLLGCRELYHRCCLYRGWRLYRGLNPPAGSRETINKNLPMRHIA